jgi:DNA segregation ATPase FtsK/SpoIIIE, S-DNA-T family
MTELAAPGADGPGIDLGTAASPSGEPISIDVTHPRGTRRPIIAPQWRGWDNIRRHLRLTAERHWHTARYHSVRIPWYAAQTSFWAIAGVFCVLGRLITWWQVPHMFQLESLHAAHGQGADYLRTHKAGKETRKFRGIILAVGAAALLIAVIAAWCYLPRWLLGLTVVAALPFLAKAGRPAGKPIVQTAVLPPQVAPPTPDVIVRALGSLGIAGINAYIKAEQPWNFPSPVREDGPGWRAEVDLPYGVTATMVIEKREALASGLRRPLGAVWPEPVTSEHAGRLELWVGRQDISEAVQPPWPWLRTGQADVFQPLPFGTDPRGRQVTVPVIEHNWLIGSLPGNGKTASVRVIACAAALDPIVESWIHELKGSGDLDPLEPVSHRFISGIDDESIAYAAESLALLRKELMGRAERLKRLPREMCPDKKVTRQIAAKRSLRLWPLMCVVDEAQNLFAHPKYGKQAAEDATFIIKIGRAFGVFLVLATQRPDKDSLPTGVSGNVSIRFCLKVAGQIENDMILGTSAYKNGIRATTFRPKTDAGLGYLVGAEGVPQVCRTYYLDIPATEKVAKRARALREAAGTLTGVALGDGQPLDRDALADVASVFLAGEPGLHWETVAERLAGRIPQRWADVTAESISAQCRGLGVPSVVVKMAGEGRRGCRRSDVETAAAGQ